MIANAPTDKLTIRFHGELDLTPIMNRDLWHVVQHQSSPYYQEVIFPSGARETLTPPQDFTTDLGSIPRFLWWIPGLSPMRFAHSFVPHDVACRDKLWDSGAGISRPIADEVLRASVLAEGGSRFWANIIYMGVRIGAAWNKRKLVPTYRLATIRPLAAVAWHNIFARCVVCSDVNHWTQDGRPAKQMVEGWCVSCERVTQQRILK